jgi:dienelactone hydrolase
VSPPEPRKTRRWWHRHRIVLLIIPVLLVALYRPATAHLRAASLLVRFADPSSRSTLASYGKHTVVETEATVRAAAGLTRARVYAPRDLPQAPGVVLVHGVHRLGIDEPRLMRFSRAVAAAGVTVLTPEVRELADYHVDPKSIETIGNAADELSARLDNQKVGLMGMSFAGGLVLLTAADARWADRIGFVTAVGAHHDLARVSRFFATSDIQGPDGKAEALKAHDYGALVLVYAHVESFFAPEDVPAARDALRLWLWDDKQAAIARAEALSPPGWARIDALFDGKVQLLRDELLAEIDRSEAAMAPVSPHGRLAGIRAQVFLLHGAQDTVIPASETLWLASEVPPERLAGVLVSPAIMHVELTGQPPLTDQWALVRFMAGMLDRAERAAP